MSDFSKEINEIISKKITQVVTSCLERIGKNEVEWTEKAEIKTAKSLAVGEACTRIFFQDRKGKTLQEPLILRRGDPSAGEDGEKRKKKCFKEKSNVFFCFQGSIPWGGGYWCTVCLQHYRPSQPGQEKVSMIPSGVWHLEESRGSVSWNV